MISMKLEPMKDKSHRAARKPLRSFKELAQDFNKTMAELRGMMAADTNAPKPIRRFSGISYYDPESFGEWMRGKAGV